MRIKRFEAASLQEALRQIKLELGPQAVILSTRQVRKGGSAFGLFSRPLVEVMAAVDDAEPAAGRAATSGAAPAQAERLAAFLQVLDPLQRDLDDVKTMLQQLALRQGAASPSLDGLAREFLAVKKMLEVLVQRHRDTQDPLCAPALLPWYQHLLASGMPEALARLLIEKTQNSLDPSRLHDAQHVQHHFARTLVKVTPLYGPLDRHGSTGLIEAFVGPTGVGKTTTIAKLAAHYALGKKRRVALLTIDTYRIAAVEQLRTFATIMRLPFEVVMTPAELEAALHRCRDSEVVLIDTAGRSQRDAVQMAELQAFFGQRRRARVHLVLSATASAHHLAETVARFQPLAPASLVFTKLDECSLFGPLLGTALQAQIPLSYFTTGQRVPEDIEVATAERLVALILTGLEPIPVAAGSEGQ
ncbi:MAG: flagellar biosynthesis protein FlhF [Candidatus Tectimicrobiota bacterium]|nr:MAG: flagellar biosynthesis protein FlhF [Candidatus Tectomicrobia bacterium]